MEFGISFSPIIRMQSKYSGKKIFQADIYLYGYNKLLSKNYFLELFHNVSTVARLDEIIEHMVLVYNEDITILPPPQIYPVTYFPSYKFVIDPRSYSKFR